MMLEDLFSGDDEYLASELSNCVFLYIQQELSVMKERGLSASTISRFKHLLQGGRANSIFRLIYNRLTEASSVTTMAHLNASKLLLSFSQTYSALDIIECYDTLNASKNSMSQGTSLPVVPQDVMDIFEFICSSIKESATATKIKASKLPPN